MRIKITYQLILALVVSCVCGQIPPQPLPEWKITVKVVDESSQPVGGADVEVSYYVKPPPERTEAGESIHGPTDTNGVFRVSHQNTGSIGLGFKAAKTGYYSATKGHEFAKFKESNPAKWNPTMTLLLKKIGKPIPMYAKCVMQMPPEREKGVGYDLAVGDWVAPDGKGKNTDIVFTSHFDKRAENDWDYKLTVSFPNAGDGIQPFTVSDLEKTSALRSPHEAPENGYEPQWVKTQSQRPGEYSRYGIDESLNFFFRVRTILDEKGNVKSANYGKIYGDFMNFCYFFNPTPNLRNVEFDTTRNLMKDLGPSEHVMQP